SGRRGRHHREGWLGPSTLRRPLMVSNRSGGWAQSPMRAWRPGMRRRTIRTLCLVAVPEDGAAFPQVMPTLQEGTVGPTWRHHSHRPQDWTSQVKVISVTDSPWASLGASASNSTVIRYVRDSGVDAGSHVPAPFP